MITRADLKLMPLFAELPPGRVEWLCSNLSESRVAVGDYLVREGEPSKGFFLLLEGEIVVSKLTDGVEMPAGRHVPPAYFGEVPLLAQKPVTVSLKAVQPSRLLRLHDDAFRELLATCPTFGREIFRTMAERISGMESFVRQREKMAALGTLSAGLAHELNNPGAAVERASHRMRLLLGELESAACRLHNSGISAAGMLAVKALLDSLQAAGTPVTDTLRLGEREDEIAEWLAERAIPEEGDLTGTLAGAGLAMHELEVLERQVKRAALPAALGWLAASLEMASLVDEAARAAARISDLVKAMRSYSYLDRGVTQEVDIHDGIEDTLLILKHKLKHGVEVVREFDRSLPRLSVFGSELNQVWTNLIDNAADAMNGKGRIRIRTRRDGDFVAVDVIDDGPGIAPEILPRIFDPFFTTKAVGKGTGIGLDIAYRTVVNRHRGHMRVKSRPGETQFEVLLPVDTPPRPIQSPEDT